MEERIIQYQNNNEIEPIIIELTRQNFLLVQHTPKTKTLHFKKIQQPPQTKHKRGETND